MKKKSISVMIILCFLILVGWLTHVLRGTPVEIKYIVLFDTTSVIFSDTYPREYSGQNISIKNLDETFKSKPFSKDSTITFWELNQPFKTCLDKLVQRTGISYTIDSSILKRSVNISIAFFNADFRKALKCLGWYEDCFVRYDPRDKIIRITDR